MSQLEVSKAEAAEERSEQTRSFVRTVKAAARRKYCRTSGIMGHIWEVENPRV